VHDALGEGLAALKRGGGLARAEHGDAAGAQGVGDAGHERGLRADHHEVHGVLDGVRRDDGGVGHVEGGHAHIAGDAGVAGRGGHVVRGVLAQQGGDDGVLAGTGT